ncbi:MAG: hypothetical protein WBP13_08230 [Methylophilaceae bacterium]
MFKNIISAITFAVSLAASAPSMALEDQSVKQAETSLTITDNSHLNSIKGSKEASQSPSATGLMLSLALISFVLLSNRRAI